MIEAKSVSVDGTITLNYDDVMDVKKVHILGTEYEIVYQSHEQNKQFDDCDGYCDPTSKRIYVRRYTDKDRKDGVFSYENAKMAERKVTRHEILHGFFYESGLWWNSGSYENAWSMCEEMIDWVAIQFPKIANAYIECGCAG